MIVGAFWIKQKSIAMLPIIKSFPGDAPKIILSGTGTQMSNKGGPITLLNTEGLKIDDVSYTKTDVEIQGELVELKWKKHTRIFY